MIKTLFSHFLLLQSPLKPFRRILTKITNFKLIFRSLWTFEISNTFIINTAHFVKRKSLWQSHHAVPRWKGPIKTNKNIQIRVQKPHRILAFCTLFIWLYRNFWTGCSLLLYIPIYSPSLRSFMKKYRALFTSLRASEWVLSPCIRWRTRLICAVYSACRGRQDSFVYSPLREP